MLTILLFNGTFYLALQTKNSAFVYFRGDWFVDQDEGNFCKSESINKSDN